MKNVNRKFSYVLPNDDRLYPGDMVWVEYDDESVNRIQKYFDENVDGQKDRWKTILDMHKTMQIVREPSFLEMLPLIASNSVLLENSEIQISADRLRKISMTDLARMALEKRGRKVV